MRQEIAGLLVDTALGLPRRAARYHVERDIAVPMPDGVTLLGDLYRPTSASGPMPVVLIRLPYGRAGLIALLYPAPLARRGFQVFLQAVRGTFGSGGHFRPFTTEHEDGLTTLTWLRRQPWCDGRVAMVGASYFGHTQWAIAPYADPPLACVSPHITSANVADRIFYDHGAPQVHTALSWSASIGRQERRSSQLDRLRPWAKSRIDRALRTLPLQAADVGLAGAPVPFWRDFVAHSEPGDDFWSSANHAHADLSAMPPVSVVTGWWDLFLAGNLADVTALQAAGIRTRLLVGPWLHGELAESTAAVSRDLEWLDHFLRGGPEPTGAPVRVFLQQADRWLEFDRWPPAQTREQVHYLRAEGLLGPEPGTEDAVPTMFTYDPADPTPTVGGPLLTPPGKQADNHVVEDRPDVVMFSSAALTTDLDVVGP
jgi:putative CocE/NonD family hydrolase